jgi:hypothetical protein
MAASLRGREFESRGTSTRETQQTNTLISMCCSELHSVN